MTQIPGEALGQLMQRLDGTCLSHSGIAVRAPGVNRGPATHIASALAENLRLDIGGVRRDPFADFWPSRDLYTVAMPDDLRERALAYLEDFPDQPGREGTFSFVKLVKVAAGLRSIEVYHRDPDLGERLYRAAHDVATSWVATPASPSWYCAELAATAYGRTFTRADLTPPPAEGAREDLDEPDELSWVVQRVRDRVDRLEDDRDRSAARLLTLLADDDRPFLVDAVTAIATSGGKLFGDVLDDLVDRVLDWVRGDEDPDPGEEPRRPEPLDDPRPMPDLPGAGDPLPHALVTPRMLWQVFGRHELRRVAQPGADRPARPVS